MNIDLLRSTSHTGPTRKMGLTCSLKLTNNLSTSINSYAP